MQNQNIAHFQDRDAAIAAFDALWERETPWILAFTGLSGHGKSTLLDWLEEHRCRRDGYAYALTGLETSWHTETDNDSRGEPPVAAALHCLLAGREGLRRFLPADALAAYDAERRRILDERARRSLALQQTQTASGSEHVQQSMSAGLAEAVREMDRQAETLLLEAWQACVIQLPGAQWPDSARVVFMFDNYDMFQERVGREDVQRFWEALDGAGGVLPGLRVLVAGREAIAHRQELHVLEHGLAAEPLDPLSPADSDALLRDLGVTDPAFRAAIYARLTQGHPLVTRLAAEAWRETPGGIPAAAVPAFHEAGRALHEQALQWIQGRILERLAEPLKSAARWAALLRWFDLDALNAVLTLPAPLTHDDFTALTRYAFITRPRLAPEKWACHDLVRRAQAAYLERACPEETRAFHTRARDYANQQARPLDTLYHTFFTDSDAVTAFEVWKKWEEDVAFRFDHERWAALFEIVDAPEVEARLTPQRAAEAHYRAGRRHYYRAEWGGADARLAQARELYRRLKSTLSEADARANGVLEGEANVLKAMGDVQAFRKENDAALDSYAQALTLYRAVGARLGEANVLKAMGDVQAFRKENDAALDSYAQALTLYRAVGARLGEANVLASLSRVAVAAGRLEEAEAQLSEIITMRRAIGSLYDEGADYGNFAIVLLNNGYSEKAGQYAHRAREIFARINLPAIVDMMDRVISVSEQQGGEVKRLEDDGRNDKQKG